MDKSWTRETNKLSESYEKGVKSFLLFAMENSETQDNLIQCPCGFCNNTRCKSFHQVWKDLHEFGFSYSYSYEEWIFHGEGNGKNNFDSDNEVEDDLNLMPELTVV